jgi:hypothetical protein
MTPAHGRCGLSISFGSFSGSLDDTAAAVMRMLVAQPPTREGPAAISGYSGYVYSTKMDDNEGGTIEMRMMILQLGPNRIATVSQVNAPGSTAEQRAGCTAVMNAAGLTRGE